jgi:hypothetical protein
LNQITGASIEAVLLKLGNSGNEEEKSISKKGLSKTMEMILKIAVKKLKTIFRLTKNEYGLRYLNILNKTKYI